MNATWVVQSLLVGTGGFIGSILRFGLSGLVHRWLPFASFPYGTLVVNIVGCSVLGALAGLAETRQIFGTEERLFLFIGVLGGFTTFSTFGWETLSLLRDAERLKAAVNVTLHIVVGLAGAWAGYAISKGW